MGDSSSQFVLATVVLSILSFSILTYYYVPSSFAYDYSPFGDDNDNHSGDSNTDNGDNRRDRGHSDADSWRDNGHSGESNSGDGDNWGDNDYSGDTNGGEGKVSDNLGQADGSHGASSSDSQSGNSAYQEGTADYSTGNQIASNNLAANTGYGLENSDPSNPNENSAAESGSVDTQESNGSSGNDNSSSESRVYVASDSVGLVTDGSDSIYSISMSNYSSTQNTQNPVDETLAAISGSMDALPSNLTSLQKGVNEVGQSNSELSNPSESSGTFQEPAISNQSSIEENLVGNQSSSTVSSGSADNSSTLGSPSTAGSTDVLLGGFSRSSDQYQIAIQGSKKTISIVNYGAAGSTNHNSATVSLDKSRYTTQDVPKINVNDHGANLDPNGIDTVRVNVTSTTDKTGIPITLVETGPKTGIFEGQFSFTSGPSSPTSIQIVSNDRVRISYVGTGGSISNSIVSVTTLLPPINNPPQTINLPATKSGESKNTPVVFSTLLSSPTPGASLLNTTSNTASLISTISASSPVTARSGNKTITVPDEGNVTLSYTSLLSQGELTALPVKTTSELAVINITGGANHKPGKLMALDNTLYIPVSTVFIIAPTDARFNGTITVAIPYNMTLASQQTSQDVKLLHYTGSTWEDVTTFPLANGHLVTGSLSTALGPVVAAVKSG